MNKGSSPLPLSFANPNMCPPYCLPNSLPPLVCLELISRSILRGGSVMEPSLWRLCHGAFSVEPSLWTFTEPLLQTFSGEPSLVDLVRSTFIKKHSPTNLHRQSVFNWPTFVRRLSPANLCHGPLHGTFGRGPPHETYVGGPLHGTFTEGPFPTSL